MHSDPRSGPAGGAAGTGARPPGPARPWPARALAAAALAALAAAARPPRAAPLPAIVFVSRQAPAGADAGQIPGLGPHGSRLRSGGRLMIRGRDGRVRALLPAGALADAQDPDVSFDARWIVFSGRAAPDSAWRIYRVRVDGTGLAAVTGPGDGPGDDFDPRWVNDQIVFVTTRTGAPPALYDGSPAGQLATLDPATGRCVRLAYERNGLLDPRVDLVHQRLVWSRWWFNPWRGARDGGVTRDAAAAIAPDSVNQWQLVGAVARALPLRVPADLADERLAAGGVPDRRAGMGVQPAVLPDGEFAAVFARNPGLAPRPGPLGVQRLHAGVSAGVRVGGAAIADSAASPYAEGRNLAAPGMCAPAALADGRLIVAADPGARGDFGLWLLDRGGEPVRELVNLPGTLELDPAPVVRRPPLRARPDAVVFDDWGATQRLFTYTNRDVFAGGGLPRTPGVRLRIYADRPASAPGAADSIGLVDDVPVGVDGAVSALLPADVALFEQLTDPDGRALLGAHGPAQVRGFNTGRAGAEARCVGCHLGHSAAR